MTHLLVSARERLEFPAATEFNPANPLDYLQDADCLACWGSTGLSGRGIEIASGGPYYHIGTFLNDRKTRKPMVVEQWQGTGGRLLPWEQWIAQRSDSVDVYRPDIGGLLKYNKEKAVQWLLDNILGQPYDWDTIRRIAREHSYLWGWFYHPCYDEDAPAPAGYVCSTARAAADKYGGGVHPITRMWIGDIPPSMLVQSKIYTYLLTHHSKPVSSQERGL